MSFQTTNPLRSAGRGLLAASLGLALILPQPALAAGGDAVWRECNDTGAVSTNHSQADYNDALTDPPADGAEYTPCIALIKAAQQKASLNGSSSNNSGDGNGNTGGGGGTPSGGSTGGGTAAPAAGAPAAPAAPAQVVPPAELQEALTQKGINPAAPAGAAAAPAPAVIGGEKIDLDSDRLPSVANTLSLPLPLAASALVVMFSAALPAIRFGVARFGAPPTGTTPSL